MAHPDHDQVIGRLVGARLRGAAARPPGGAAAVGPHPDAETWAAYMDGGLPADEVGGLEAHLAACAVCRSLVAALAPEVSTAAGPAVRGAEPAPAGPANVIPFPRRQVFAWMAMAAGLFGAVTLWSVSRLGSDRPVSSVAVSAPPLADAPAPAAAAPLDQAAGASAPLRLPPPAPQTEAGRAAAASRRATAPAELDRAKVDVGISSRAAQPAAAAGAIGSAPAELERADATSPAVAAAVPPAPAATGDTRQIPLQTNTVAAGAARPRGPLATQAGNQQQNAAPVPADAASADARERRANEQQAGQLAEAVVTTEASGARREAAGQARRQAGADRSGPARSKDEAAKALAFSVAAPAAPPPFAEPGGRLQWRIAEGRRLESSSDGGATWNRRHEVARGERLWAGTAPAIDSAWAVGERGLVLRLVVPGGWMAVSRPDTVTLTSVSASGAQSARVTAADGRVFETADGGATWTLAAGAGPR